MEIIHNKKSFNVTERTERIMRETMLQKVKRSFFENAEKQEMFRLKKTYDRKGQGEDWLYQYYTDRVSVLEELLSVHVACKIKINAYWNARVMFAQEHNINVSDLK